MSVKKGDKIKVEYEGKLEDGTVFDSSENHGEPLEFEIGNEQMLPAFEEQILGMELNEEKEFTLEPKKAYGEYDGSLQETVPKSELPDNQELEAGMLIIISVGEDMQIPAKIKEVKEDSVTIDLNHPLAGKTLNFRIKVVEIAS
jgi:FKBP-type peptidyl-prolyl cis-trans isomerase 2